MKTHSLYIASMEPESGKLLITMGMMELLTCRIKKVAFFRPLIDESRGSDKDIQLIRSKYCPGMSYEDCYGLEIGTLKALESQGKRKEIYEQLLIKFNTLKKNYDFVLCEGLNSSEFLASFDIRFNLEIAKNLSCPLIAVINGADQDCKGIQEEINIAANTIRKAGCTHFATFVNRISAVIFRETQTINHNFSFCGINSPTFFLPEEDELDKASLADIQQELNARCIMGSADDLHRVVRQFKVATMTMEHFLSYIEEGDLIIVGGDRADIILASITTVSSHNYPHLAGILLTGGFTPEANMLKLLKGMVLSVPVLSVAQDTFASSRLAEKVKAVIAPENQRKIALGLGIFDTYVNAEKIFNQADITVSHTMTPIMFEHNLFERARARCMNIVLPEASDERILRATEILLRRQVVKITLLGNEKEIRTRCASLGIDIKAATIIDPLHSEYLASYTVSLLELRHHKGLTSEGAVDALTDVSYFATMMVYQGHADGMVSGAIHTTGHTIRPALQIIKTPPGISIVSSVFIMCLDTEVLVYGDCAVNPDPTAEQLAEIAISSAQTAEMLGIEPRIAMLSYSTGFSGKGKDVDKVRKATAIVAKKRPDLLVDGPIQYDAAISPEVARTKLPDSNVAGNASVFVFPDLNTGNNTYKAVQRSSGATAIGPILQGLNKPVNDLSRGCSVTDIINTIAITAIQAQAFAAHQQD